MCVLDSKLNFIDYSNIWLTEFNIEHESIVGMNYYEVIPDTPEEIRKIHKEALEGKNSASQGQKFIKPDGSIQWLKWKISPWKEDDGSIGGIIVVKEDITTEKRSEELLRKAKKVARIGGWEVDLVANTVHWTEMTREIHEVDEDYVPNLEEGINFYKPGKDREMITTLVSESISEGTPFDTDLRIITAKGREIWVRAKGEAELVNGKCVRLYGTFQDIDEKKRVELKYQEVSDRMAIATNAANIGVWEYKLADNSLVWDDNMYKLYGVDKNDFSGVYEAWESAIHPEDKERSAKEVEMAIKGEKDFDTEFRVVWPNGEIRHINAEGVVKRNEQGEPILMIGTNWDITREKNSERKLKDLLDVSSEQNKSLMNFAHIVSHNLRSHASNLSMLSGFLLNEKSEEEKANLIKMLDEATESLNETVQHLNEVVQVKTTAAEKIRPLNLYEAVKTVEKNLSGMLKEEEARCKVIIDKSLKVNAIPAYLDSVLLNLFTNSLKYRSPDRKLEIKVIAEKNDKDVLLLFRDNGLGIDMEKHGGKIFGMYKTFHRHKDAKGIGLFITKNQMESMNGSIAVESTVGKGTEFQLKFRSS